MRDTAAIPQERQEVCGEVIRAEYITGKVALRQGPALTIRDERGRFEVTVTVTRRMAAVLGCADPAGRARLVGKKISVSVQSLRPSPVEHGRIAHFTGVRPTRPLLLPS